MIRRLPKTVAGLLVVPGSAIDLAVVRIVFFVVALPFGLSHVPSQMAELPHELRDVPVGAGPLYWLLPPNTEVARIGSVVMVLAALAAIFGLKARWAAGVWAITALWVMGIPNLFGKVNHEHHLLWFAVLLAASPCADVLSLDALRSRKALPADHVRYGLPIRLWWLLLGVIYFFPGMWKLGEQGLGWASPTNMRSLLYGTWAGNSEFTPLLRVDHWPVALVLMGLFTMVFELGFVFAAFSRHRWLAPLAGICFHTSTYAILDISFVDLMACYVAFIPWAATLHLGDSVVVASEPPTRRANRATVVLGGVLAVGAIGFGLTSTLDGWPFAAYPTFAGRYAPTRTVLDFEVQMDDGTTQATTLDEVFAWVPSSRRTRIADQFLGLPPDEQRAVLLEIELPDELQGHARVVTVFQASYRTDPDDPGLETRYQITEVAIPPGA